MIRKETSVPTETNHEPEPLNADGNTVQQLAASQSRPLTLTQLLSRMAKRKRLTFSAILSGGLVAAIVALLLPNTYTATAVIMQPQKDQSSATMLLGQLGPLAAAASADLGIRNPADLYVGLLSSRTIADHVIAKFGLKAVYRTQTETDSRKEFAKHTSFRAGRDSLIRIEAEDVDPKRAAAIANALTAELDLQNKRLAVTQASETRRFLEEQLRQAKSDLADAEDAMKTTQQKTGLIEVTGQAQVAIASAAQLRAQITATEVNLSRLKTAATAENPTVIQAQAELNSLRNQLRQLGNSSTDSNSLIGTSALPQAGLGYLRRLRDLKYHEFLFELLSKQYEAARLDESKSTPAIQVVDEAIPPDKKSGPHRSLIIALGLLAGAVAALAFAYAESYRFPGRRKQGTQDLA